MNEIRIPNIPDKASIPQTDYLEEIGKLREELRAITIDGPSGTHFKRVLDRLLVILGEVL